MYYMRVRTPLVVVSFSSITRKNHTCFIKCEAEMFPEYGRFEISTLNEFVPQWPDIAILQQNIVQSVISCTHPFDV